MNPREANSGKIGDQRNSVMYIAGELQRTHQTALEAQVHLSYRSLVRVMAEIVAEQDVCVYVCVRERDGRKLVVGTICRCEQGSSVDEREIDATMVWDDCTYCNEVGCKRQRSPPRAALSSSRLPTMERTPSMHVEHLKHGPG